ncbi:Appr-1-p processing domain protein [Tolypothrix tenuis PCC 7101]|uniref:Appr-1-p processing domain protein n=1 Tax=Tolypothrix tenuis PCC 7101 TaxID=231146 RepID=A0A1Z4N4R6_9CYAN|nr:macro domain-containing protein [Aulosira sp. FACHB-113]BAZ00665.1 Appr-1-p processing domain protein [Tolypothrix tenuis PCC 7101]BAZ75412.1 Appr-1-p processing domain protein [Aulosira laxa NIES-50]
MIPEISTISLFIGIIAGMSFYLDGWRVSSENQTFSKSYRYRGLLVVIGGGVISPIIDRFLLETDKYDFFKGYLFGVVIGWLVLFTSVTLLYVFWKNTKDLSPNEKYYRFGQICYSFIEIIYGGINVDPIRQQKEIESQLAKNKLVEIRQKLREENPKAYVAFEEQLIKTQQQDLKAQKENLESLKTAIERADYEPEQEAENLIKDKQNLIQTLQSELELARSRYSQGHEKIQKIVDEYTKQLRHQEDEIRELRELIHNFRNQSISQEEFTKRITFKQINQYESGGLFIGELAVNNRLVKIYQGDITNLVADVIVSSDDNYLTMGGGVSYRIRSVGGGEIYSEAQKLVPASIGDVLITTAGALSAQKIFHGIVIDYNDNRLPSKKVIEQVIHTCIEKANDEKYRSIAFPLLGTGAGGFPAIEALEIILSQVIKDFSDEPQSVAEVIIAIYGRVAQVIDIEAVIKEVTRNSRD